MTKKIIFISGSRADFFLIERLYDFFKKKKITKNYFCLSGGSSELSFIKKFVKFKNFFKIKFNHKSDDVKNTSIVISNAIKKFTKLFIQIKPNFIVILGDRYEILASAISAYNLDIKIIHFHGGEITLGSKDNEYRNSISIFSNYHFVSNNLFKKKLINILGKSQKKNIFSVGSIGAEAVKKIKIQKKEILEKKLKIKFSQKNFLITIHSETKSRNFIKKLNIFFRALKKFKNTSFYFTYPGYDINYTKIIDKIRKINKLFKNLYIFRNLGHIDYISLAKNCDVVIGNSSSGLIEIPSINVPVINIGDRQLGRLKSKNVVDCDLKYKDIVEKLNIVLKRKKTFVKNPYEKSNTIEKVYKITSKLIKHEKMLQMPSSRNL